MKAIKILCIALLGAGAVACTSNPTVKTKNDLGFSKAEIDSLSVALGQNLGIMVAQSGIEEADIDLVCKTMKSVFAQGGEVDPMVYQQSGQVIQSFMAKKQELMSKKNEDEGKDFLEVNKTKEGVQTTESGLQYKIENPGNEVRPAATDTVEVHYRGTLLNGKEFDSSYKRNEPAKFPLNRVIPGWTEGLQLFGEGGKGTLYLPSDLAYGPNGAGGEIGPNAVLIFEVELIKVYPAAPQAE